MREADGGGGGSVFTPPVGSPGAIRAAATKLKGEQSSVSGLASAAKRTSGGLVGTSAWQGSAADGYARFAGNVETLTSSAEDPVGEIVRGANKYADALETAQHAISSAASRHQAAVTRAQTIADTTNNDPNRTQAQVHHAQKQVDKANQDASDAIADAQRAWSTYETDSGDAAKIISAAGDSLDSGTRSSPVRTVLESAEEKEHPEGEDGEESPDAWEIWENAFRYGHELPESVGSFLKYGAFLSGGAAAVRSVGSGANLTYALGQALSGEFGEILKGETLPDEEPEGEDGGDGADGDPDGEPGEPDAEAPESAEPGEGASVVEEAGDAAEELSGGAKVLSGAGKLLGPVGVVTGGYTAYREFSEGKAADGTYDTVATGLGAAALVSPPPADLALGAAAGVMVVTKIVDPHIADQVADVGKDIGHAASSAAHKVASVVSDLNPF